MIVEGFKIRKLVGGVFMFGGVDLFVGKKFLFIEDKSDVDKKELVKKEEGIVKCKSCFC